MTPTIKNLKDMQAVFHEIKKPIVGIGVTAFNRLGLEDIVPAYRIVALRYSLDTPAIEKDMEVYSLERGRPGRHLKCKRNATAVLYNRRTQKYLNSLPGKPALLFYKTTKKIQAECRRNGWLMIGNPPRFGKESIENKVFFRNILEKCQIETIPGETNNLANVNFETLNQKYGPRFVIQLPDRGGGKGTFFINSEDDFNNFINHNRVKQYDTPPDLVITKFIVGPSPSLTACVTREGILSTGLQYQLLDIPELWNLKKGSGLFSGHDWSQAIFNEKVQKQANRFAEKIGSHLASLGYKGIFGLDMLLDNTTEKLYIVECNPRLLGSFPCLPMIQINHHEPPLLGFHTLEFLRTDYKPDIAKINKIIRQPKIGSQMILHNLLYQWAENKKEVAAGIYQYKNGCFVFDRPGYHYKHLKNQDEFLIADGVPVLSSRLTPNQRLFRLLSLRGVLNLKTNQLNSWGHRVATWIYKELAITPLHEQPEVIDD